MDEVKQLSVYADFKQTQLFMLAAYTRVINACRGTHSTRVDPAVVQEIMQSAAKLFSATLARGKVALGRLCDALRTVSSAPQGDTREAALAQARARARELNQMNRRVMEIVFRFSDLLIKHKGCTRTVVKNGEEVSEAVCPPLDPRERLDMTAFNSMLRESVQAQSTA